MFNAGPQKQGLYNPITEKDSCGIGAVLDINGLPCHEIVSKALTILKHMKHRGAVGADATTGDGAGIMTQIPHLFFSEELEKLDLRLPEIGDYAVGSVFLPRVPQAKLYCEGILEQVIKEEHLKLIGWREVPMAISECGLSARATRPDIMQLFIKKNDYDSITFERKLLIIRKRAEKIIRESGRPYTDAFYICSLSSQTLIYKGQILGYKLDDYYLDLKDERYLSAMAIVHERYSTNTFPSWQLAQPFRYLAHNGEINTIRGNINWMNAREGVMQSGVFGNEFHKILPIIEPGGSDSASLDNALEHFMANGHPMAYSMMLLIPEPWQNDEHMTEKMRCFYEYHARIMEPWDGPAALLCSNGRQVMAKLDRNGLRPARVALTESGKVVIASEIGVVDFEDDPFISKDALEPGKIFLVDMDERRIVPDEEIKEKLSIGKNYVQWVQRNRITLKDIRGDHEIKRSRLETRIVKEKVFGYTNNEKTQIIHYMAENKKEPIGSMGIDEPIAILSNKNNLLFDYFRQAFAQVTNPPIDPFRERSVVSLRQFIGSHGRCLDEIEIERDKAYLMVKSPILSSSEIEDIRHLNDKDFNPVTLPALFLVDQDNGLEKALNRLCERAETLVKNGHNILIISDRDVNYYNAPMPSLLALGAVHHHLIRKKLRTATDIIIETGEARDVMHMALLIGYGAVSINPYMVYEQLTHDGDDTPFNNYKEAISEGLLKVISRMGISTLPSYNGAQIFEALGIASDVIDKYFTDTPSRVGGIDLKRIEEDVLERHRLAYDMSLEKSYDSQNMFDSKTIKKCHQACSTGDPAAYRAYVSLISAKKSTIRDHLTFKNQSSIPLEDVESVESILKRFTVSGMSFGSLSQEAHETIAIAMNRLGATSNCGEGGEDPKRYTIGPKGNVTCSAVKQIASGRFGVTTDYLVNCDEIQVKMAQGAKPGEGGHLPGKKVTPTIAKTRHATPGSDLISPPPHHDIYSIEDLAQLIFDMKNVNPNARIGVKLVAGHGVGTVAAGVAKAHADVIKISGSDGGTGASAISSMKYVGLPWEMGLAETQQTLLLNDLRKRVKIQVDGKLRHGRDLIVATLLGAEEFGFGTLAMMAIGCTLCRQCHKGMCPVGIATQDKKKRQAFTGKPEHLINLMKSMAGEVREYMAQLGFRKLEDMVGRTDLLKVKEKLSNYVTYFDFSPILFQPILPKKIPSRCTENQQHQINDVLDQNIIAALKGNLKTLEWSSKIKNTDRSFATMLSGYLTKHRMKTSLKLTLHGAAGQSFGAFMKKGIQITLIGECNDYMGKGLSGGHIAIRADEKEDYPTHKNTLVGNTALYGATSGEVYLAGRAGQRFAVRNSGATAVVEGIGNHGLEYMTGGVVLILGHVGQNFAAGMTGGTAYVYDEDNALIHQLNKTYTNADALNDDDEKHVLDLLKKHTEKTLSSRSQYLLSHWQEHKIYFKKVTATL